MFTPTKSFLSPNRRRLVELMQRVNFGRIEKLVIRNGEPVLERPAPRVVLEVKFAAENGPHAEASADDFALKSQLVDLLSHLDCLQNATIEVLTIKHGLPFTMHVEAQD